MWFSVFRPSITNVRPAISLDWCSSSLALRKPKSAPEGGVAGERLHESWIERELEALHCGRFDRSPCRCRVGCAVVFRQPLQRGKKIERNPPTHLHGAAHGREPRYVAKDALKFCGREGGADEFRDLCPGDRAVRLRCSHRIKQCDDPASIKAEQLFRFRKRHWLPVLEKRTQPCRRTRRQT